MTAESRLGTTQASPRITPKATFSIDSASDEDLNSVSPVPLLEVSSVEGLVTSLTKGAREVAQRYKVHNDPLWDAAVGEGEGNGLTPEAFPAATTVLEPATKGVLVVMVAIDSCTWEVFTTRYQRIAIYEQHDSLTAVVYISVPKYYARTGKAPHNQNAKKDGTTCTIDRDTCRHPPTSCLDQTLPVRDIEKAATISNEPARASRGALATS
ncbi:hypothetical protein FPV67DRAFT_1451586 [Lyophyllum atratum]|nr:hypothetical protein FPV67DRAFT_1451586 [Lyophyllum atratum]